MPQYILFSQDTSKYHGSLIYFSRLFLPNSFICAIFIFTTVFTNQPHTKTCGGIPLHQVCRRRLLPSFCRLIISIFLSYAVHQSLRSDQLLRHREHLFTGERRVIPQQIIVYAVFLP